MKKILLLSITLLLTSCQLVFQDTIVINVTEKERIVKNEESKYLIFTENETFENTDYFFKFKFNSSDLYGKIQKGGTYKVDVGGIRIPLLSKYRNIHKLY